MGSKHINLILALFSSLASMKLTASEEVVSFAIGYEFTTGEKECQQKELDTLDDFFIAVGAENGFAGAVPTFERRLAKIQRFSDHERALEEGLDSTPLMAHKKALLDILGSMTPDDPEERRLGCHDICGSQYVTEWQQWPWVQCCPCCVEHCRRRNLHD